MNGDEIDEARRAESAQRAKSQQLGTWGLLRHSTVVSWTGRVGEPWLEEVDAPILRDAPFAYLNWLIVELGHNAQLEIYSGMLNFEYSLFIIPGATLGRGSEAATPNADLGHFPTGPVEAVELRPDADGGYVEARLMIGGMPLLVVAGDVVEGRVGTQDEELLVFTAPSDADGIEWFSRGDFDWISIE